MFNRKASLPFLHYATTLSTPIKPDSPSVNLRNAKFLLNRRIISPSLIAILFFFLYWSNYLSSSHIPKASLSILTEKYKIGLNRLTRQPIPTKVNLADRWKNVGIEIDLDQSLETRLKDWENSPLEGIEASDWVIESLKVCTPERIIPNQNNFLLDSSHFLWSSLNTHKIGELRRELTAYLRRAQAEGRMGPSAWGVGKGLVFTAGNADTFSRVLTSLKLLNKHLDTHLPVEIFSFPGEVPSAEDKKELEKFGAKFIVVEDAIKDATMDKSYHIKATAIIRSSFREVLYLDSDNLPTAGLSPIELASPGKNGSWAESAGLWEAKAYKRLGVMFWSDYWRTGADNPIWSIIGVVCRDEWEQESGQILIDKSVHLDALLLAEFMLDSSRFKFWMHFSDGDKDIFRYSFLALRKRWGVPGRYVGVGAFMENTASGFGGHTMLQHDHLGKPIFVHANMLKHVDEDIDPDYTFGRTKSLSIPLSRSRISNGQYFINETDISEFIDHDVDCDQLANADIEGNAIKAAGASVRRRAVHERSVAAIWHGGSSYDPLALDMSYTDRRTWDEKEQQLENADEQFRQFTNGIHEEVGEGGKLNSYEGSNDSSKGENSDTSLTSVTADGLNLFWGSSSLVVRKWSEDVRLKDFSKTFFAEGGSAN